MTRQEEDTKRYFVTFCLFLTTFRLAKFFDWTTLLIRNAFSNDGKDNNSQGSDRHTHRRDDGKGDPAKRDDDDLFKYQATGGREQSDVREKSRRRREKDEGEKKTGCCGC